MAGHKFARQCYQTWWHFGMLLSLVAVQRYELYVQSKTSEIGYLHDPDAPELSEIKMTLISVEFPKITK